MNCRDTSVAPLPLTSGCILDGKDQRKETGVEERESPPMFLAADRLTFLGC